MSEQAALLEEILSGRNRQLQLLAAEGMVPLPPEQLIPIQIGLTHSPDPEMVAKATSSLQQIEPALASAFAEHQAGELELRYFAARLPHPAVLRAILGRRDAPLEVLRDLAPTLDGELQEVLVLRQDAILEDPGILVALEQNPQLSAYTRRRIWEYREHLLPRDKVPYKKPAEILAEADRLTEEEIVEAVEEVRTVDGEGQEIESAGLNEGQVRALPVPVRIRLARTANRQLRGVLIRDHSTDVALTVLRSPQMSDQELERFAHSRAVKIDVLRALFNNREWIRKYNIARALVHNPKSPLPDALKLLPKMTVRDLRGLARDKNVAQAVRASALRLYQARR